ncbi:hypothetical protein ACIG0D_27235 [Streptomyces sp. NPDC052773]|uniref:hypothetical protein n=1 Tax=Streptomyces sp. NPDC052773 TaxID=3365693 RepID=UPI0037D36686
MSIKRAVQSFTAYVDGMPRSVRAGDLVEDGDPVLKGRAHLFEDVETHVAQGSQRPRVEAATAAPGEQRDLTPPSGDSGTTSPRRGRRGGK